jgi:hypothetical protein
MRRGRRDPALPRATIRVMNVSGPLIPAPNFEKHADLLRALYHLMGRLAGKPPPINAESQRALPLESKIFQFLFSQIINWLAQVI